MLNTCYKMIDSNYCKSLNIQQKKFSFCEEVTVKLLKRKNKKLLKFRLVIALEGLPMVKK
jgi:hypothetical protein